MKPLGLLITVAAVANLTTVILYEYAASQPGGSGLAMVFSLLWMPALWLISIITTTIICIVKRKVLFKKHVLKWTLAGILFATPVPMYAVYYFTLPNSFREGSSEYYQNGKVFISETWVKRRDYKKVVEKKYVADSVQESMLGQDAYKKDGAWVYFNDKEDTLKLEYYKNDTLGSVKWYKRK